LHAVLLQFSCADGISQENRPDKQNTILAQGQVTH